MALFPAESLPGGSTTGDADGSGCRAVAVVGGQAGCATCEVQAAFRPFERMEKEGRAMTQPQRGGVGGCWTPSETAQDPGTSRGYKIHHF